MMSKTSTKGAIKLITMRFDDKIVKMEANVIAARVLPPKVPLDQICSLVEKLGLNVDAFLVLLS